MVRVTLGLPLYLATLPFLSLFVPLLLLSLSPHVMGRESSVALACYGNDFVSFKDEE